MTETPPHVEIKIGDEWSDVSHLVDGPVTVEKGRTRPLWRFDVPEVPSHVQAFRDAVGRTYVRDAEDPNGWNAHPAGHQWAPFRFRDLAQHCALPLVECEDPRGAQG